MQVRLMSGALSRRKSVCVLGSGVIGLSCVKAIIDSAVGCKVTVISASSVRDEETTSYGSGGLWKPNLIQGDQTKIKHWGDVTFNAFLDLYYSKDAASAGVSLMTAHHLFEDEAVESAVDMNPFWKDSVLNFTHLSHDDLRKLRLPLKYTRGFSYQTLVVQQSLYLPFLRNMSLNAGVVFIEKKLTSLSSFLASEEADEFDTIINCTGLGSSELVQDKELYPIRGTIVRVIAPWMKGIWFFGTSYVIPNSSNVILGGTADSNEWNTAEDAVVNRKILNDIAAVFPALAQAPIVLLPAIFSFFSEPHTNAVCV